MAKVKKMAKAAESVNGHKPNAAQAAAHEKELGSQTNGHEVILSIPLTDILVDHDWNARSQGSTFSEGSGADESSGLTGLAESIIVNGQDTPAIVRPNPTKSRHAYMLVAGHRRFVAMQKVWDPKFKGSDDFEKNVRPNVETWAPGLTKGTIKAQLRHLDETQARALNARENVERDDLSGPDLAFAVREMASLGMSDSAIAADWGKTQGYISKLHRIVKNVDGAIVKMWRDARNTPNTPFPDGTVHPPVQITVEEMHSLQLPDNKDRQLDAYREYVLKEKGERGPAAKIQTATKRAATFGTIFGKLLRLNVLQDMVNDAEGMSLVDDIDTGTKHNASSIDVIVPLWKDATKADRKKVAKAFKEAFLTAKDAEEVTEEEGEEASA